MDEVTCEGTESQSVSSPGRQGGTKRPREHATGHSGLRDGAVTYLDVVFETPGRSVSPLPPARAEPAFIRPPDSALPCQAFSKETGDKTLPNPTKERKPAPEAAARPGQSALGRPGGEGRRGGAQGGCRGAGLGWQSHGGAQRVSAGSAYRPDVRPPGQGAGSRVWGKRW